MKGAEFSTTVLKNLLNFLSKQFGVNPEFSIEIQEEVENDTSCIVRFSANDKAIEFPLLFPNEENVYIALGEKLVTPYVIIPDFKAANEEDEENEEEPTLEENRVMNLDAHKVAPGYLFAVASTLFYYLSSGKLEKAEPHLNKLYGKKGALFCPVFRKEKKTYGVKILVFQDLENLNDLERNFLAKKVVYPREKVPESMRYPHESHVRRVDLFETPESEKIGLLLSLTENASFNPETLSIEEGDLFSLATYQIPFILHSDGARVLMGSKNLKQAMPLKNPEEPIVKAEKSLKLGVNAFVVYMLYKGLNFEDGIVVSESFAKKMLSEVEETYKVTLMGIFPSEIEEKGNTIVFSWEASKKSNEIKTEVRLCKDIGSKIRRGDTLVEMSIYENGKNIKKVTKRYEGYYDAVIETIKIHPPKYPFKAQSKEESEMLIEFRLKVIKPLKVGDKLSGRHGNKGVVSKILPDEKMPEVFIDGRWQKAEVLLSPLGVVSRMNLGQLYETTISPLIKKGLYQSVFPMNYRFSDEERKNILERLRDLGADELGRYRVRFEGREIRALAGFQYIIRLDHCVGDKIHVIGRNAPISPITFQPFKGRRRKGGQRFGEMEFWCLLEHNAFKTLEVFRRCNTKDYDPTPKLNEALNVLIYKLGGKDSSGENFSYVVEEGKTKIVERIEKSSILENEHFNNFLESLAKQNQKQFINLFKKEGYVRNVMIARRLFYSGRSVIVPAPYLEPDTVLLPAEFGKAFTGKDLSLEELNKWAKGKYVLLNRQPSLHKNSVLAFKFRFWNELAIGFPILACKGFNADFDGDTMAVYFPIEQSQELVRMTIKNVPFTPENGSLAISVDQDFVYGLYRLGKAKNKKEAQKYISGLIQSGKFDEAVNALQEALEKATEENLTLSIYEIEKDEGSFKIIKETKCRGNEVQYTQLNEKIDHLNENFLNGVSLENYIDYIAKRARRTLMDKKLHVANAGDFTRELVEILGDVILEEEGEGVLEYSLEDIEWLSETGLLKNALLGRYDLDERKFLEESDLDEISKNPRKVRIYSPIGGKVTRRSFGLDPATFKPLEVKYVGVYAGHTIGERGTQLSMETFHTGKPFNMAVVRAYIFRKLEESKSFVGFIKKLSTEIDEDRIRELFSSSKGIFEKLDLNFIYFEILFEEMKKGKRKILNRLKSWGTNENKEKMKELLKERGFLTAISYQNGHNLVKLVEKGDSFEEKHPRAFMFSAYKLKGE
ncbi:hypothetical protein [Thermotoga sp. SG1]|uniref:hypothetical protein n=1 Tax=Thermotoga sp. SG1 TaxID=126739 RepID=UPI000C763E15|nr:hypothetical protein [Thermotoga sp. SG1]PLV57142.1 hypothetical protein AS006_02270 [Thermotoga sp. SG1]